MTDRCDSNAIGEADVWKSRAHRASTALSSGSGRREEKDIGPDVVVAPAWFSAGHPRSHLVAAGPKTVRRGAGSQPFGEVVAPRVIGHDSAKRVARLTESAHGRK